MKEKVFNLKKKIAVAFSSVFAFCLFALGSFAAEGDGLSTSITSITGALTSFSAANVVLVIVAGLGIAVPLVLTWFAFRWIYRKAKGALKRGS